MWLTELTVFRIDDLATLAKSANWLPQLDRKMAACSLPAARSLLTFHLAFLLVFCVDPNNSEGAEQGLLGRSETVLPDRISYEFQGKPPAWGKGSTGVNGLFDALAHRRNVESTGGWRQRCRRGPWDCFRRQPSEDWPKPEPPPLIKLPGRPQHACRDFFELQNVLESRVPKLIIKPVSNIALLGYEGLYLMKIFLVQRKWLTQKLIPLHTDLFVRNFRYGHSYTFLLNDWIDEGKVYKIRVTDEKNRYFCKGKFVFETNEGDFMETRWL